MPGDRLPRKSYNRLLHMQELGKCNWAHLVKELLCVNGFGLVWLQQGVGSVKILIRTFRQRLEDSFPHNWHSELENSSRLEVYPS